jgi:hypothetical protein
MDSPVLAKMNETVSSIVKGTKLSYLHKNELSFGFRPGKIGLYQPTGNHL